MAEQKTVARSGQTLISPVALSSLGVGLHAFLRDGWVAVIALVVTTLAWVFVYLTHFFPHTFEALDNLFATRINGRDRKPDD
ncbi:MAG TPA: hypothetical protein VGR43_01555 [Dehalococcoidia bacterium]|jgi:hypothetical protein|nr:hypothetical protein [Dehalococcoidia bacterium]